VTCVSLVLLFGAVYRSMFSTTFKEMRAPKGHYKYVIPAVLGTTLVSYAYFIFVKENCE